MNDVVIPLARHFGIATYVDRSVAKLVRHKYGESESIDDTRTAAGSSSAPGSAASVGSSPSFLDALQHHGMAPGSVQRLK